jgi:hypothetical protein
MAGALAVQLAELLQIVHGHIVPRQVQHSIQQRAAVAIRQDKSKDTRYERQEQTSQDKTSKEGFAGEALESEWVRARRADAKTTIKDKRRDDDKREGRPRLGLLLGLGSGVRIRVGF